MVRLRQNLSMNAGDARKADKTRLALARVPSFSSAFAIPMAGPEAEPMSTAESGVPLPSSSWVTKSVGITH